MEVYSRMEGTLTSRRMDFFPFFFLSDAYYLKGYSQKHWIKELSGDKHFRYLCAFERWSHMWDAVRDVISRFNVGNPSPVQSYSDLPILHLRSDPVSQFLMQTGMTLFKGLEFQDLHRLQLDIETYSQPAAFSNPHRRDDRIILVALSDNRGMERVLGGKHTSEEALLRELVDVLRKADPDVIEGHNIFNFDLPFIMRRCELHGIQFAIGRDGSVPSSFDGRMSFAERTVDTTTYEIAGRHIIDTLFLVQSYDATKRTLESYGLKYAAKHFGFARPDRVYIEGDKISWYWDHDPEALKRYSLDDVTETRSLSEYLSPSVFYLTQMIPFGYGSAARSGSSAKIESMLLREYIRQRASVPQRDIGMQTTGGYTDIFYTGVLGPVLDADVESLYPSLMLSEGISPRSESLGIFLPLLESLTRMRLEAKKKMKKAPDAETRSKFDAMQSSYKILINSFYGYLGYAKALFSDYLAADAVTKTGQKILRHLMTSIRDRDGKVIEVDTDGIFFVPPPDVLTEADESRFLGEITKGLPSGINLSTNGRYESMLSYKMKNYALLSHDRRLRIKGSSLTSRAIEKFGRKFIQECIEALLRLDVAGLHGIYLRNRREIIEHTHDIADLCRTESLKETEADYLQTIQAGTRNRSASYEVAIAEGVRWKPGDRIRYYITGNDENARGFEHCKLAEQWDPNFRDENVPYYLKRLDEQARKFDVFFLPQDFQAIFSVEGLFEFSPEGIAVQTRMVKDIGGMDLTTYTPEPVDPKIWLDENNPAES